MILGSWYTFVHLQKTGGDFVTKFFLENFPGYNATRLSGGSMWMMPYIGDHKVGIEAEDIIDPKN